MSLDDRERWQQRHRQASCLMPRSSVLALPPCPFPGAIALDLACGQGRHTTALRDAGYRVVAMDVSRLALERVPGACAQSGEVLAVEADVDAWPFAAGAFDLILQVDFLDRRLFPHLRRCLRPGGLLLIDTFLDRGHRNAEGPSRPEFLLRPDELPRLFADFELLHYREHGEETARAEMLARRR